MKQCIKNTVSLEVTGVNLHKITDIVVYVSQGKNFWQKTPTVSSATQMYFTLTKDEAMKLIPGKAKIQFAFTDGNLNNASEVVAVDVGELLDRSGYDGN